MAVRRWVHDPNPGWQRREIHLIQHGEMFLIRRIGQVWLPDEEHPSRESAEQSVAELLAVAEAKGEVWFEAPGSYDSNAQPVGDGPWVKVGRQWRRP